MKRKWRTLLPAYEEALRRYLAPGRTGPLHHVQKLGRRAVAMGLETLDLAILHEQALINLVLPVSAPASRNRMIERARTFFAHAILPIEETHRIAKEAIVDLARLNRALSRRTQDLATSNRGLKKEIARRLIVENTLRQSERHTNHLLQQSRDLQEQLRFLSRQILSVQEEERRRISRELHDVIGQVLTGINVRLATLKLDAVTNTRGLTQSISRTQRLVEKSVDIVHRFARELRPAVLDDLGLIPALHSSLKVFSKETGIHVRLTAFAGVEALSVAKRTILYRVAQEALTNVARHAQASKVDILFQQRPHAVSMQIKDDGRAFELAQALKARKGKRLGLLGMRERVEMVGGTFTVNSVRGEGTTVLASIPHRKGRKEKSRP